MQDELENRMKDGKKNAKHELLRFPFASKATPDAMKGRASDSSVAAFGSKPIADLFPSATVLFADIEGFTAWSSVREPAQVFTLLETVYGAFDG